MAKICLKVSVDISCDTLRKWAEQDSVGSIDLVKSDILCELEGALVNVEEWFDITWNLEWLGEDNNS